MNFNNKNIITLIFVQCIFCINVFAQDPELPSEEVEVLQNFEATLEETEKLNLIPALPPLDNASKNLTYAIPTRNVAVEYLPPKIRPLAIKGAEIKAPYYGFAKIGYGFPSTPFAELNYHLIEEDQYDFSINALHHSAKRNSIEHQKFSESSVGLDGNYYLENGIAVGANMGFTTDNVFYYGYDHNIMDYTENEAKQRFNTIDLGARIFNGSRTDGDINYAGDIDFYNLKERYQGVDENGIKIDLEGNKWFNEKHPLNIRLIADFTTFNNVSSQTLNNFYLQPNFVFHKEKFKVKVGVNVASSEDEFHIFPDAEVSVNILGRQLTGFAGAGGDLQKNNLQNLTDYNPYINTVIDLTNTKYFHFYGGVRGNIKAFEYTGQIGYKNTDNLPMYINDVGDTRLFQVVYDDVNIFILKGSVSARIVKNLDVGGTLVQRVYSPETFDKAWHLPAMEANFNAKYWMLNNRLRLNGELYMGNGLPFVNTLGETDRLNALFDISLGAEYQMIEHVGLFLELNNLASNKREIWNNYPTFGANILAGITARF